MGFKIERCSKYENTRLYITRNITLKSQDTVLIIAVLAIIVISVMLVGSGILFPGPETYPVVKQTWYFFPDQCLVREGWDMQLCIYNEDCGWGRLYKGSKGQGPVDYDERWKMREGGGVTIDYAKCDEDFPKFYRP